jgi:hypothetical protein
MDPVGTRNDAITKLFNIKTQMNANNISLQNPITPAPKFSFAPFLFASTIAIPSQIQATFSKTIYIGLMFDNFGARASRPLALSMVLGCVASPDRWPHFRTQLTLWVKARCLCQNGPQFHMWTTVRIGNRAHPRPEKRKRESSVAIMEKIVSDAKKIVLAPKLSFWRKRQLPNHAAGLFTTTVNSFNVDRIFA